METKTNQKQKKSTTMKKSDKKVVNNKKVVKKMVSTETKLKMKKLSSIPKNISESETLNVKSSWVNKVVYERKKKNLFIETKDGNVYMVMDVSPQRFTYIKNAESVGSKINKLFNSLS